MRNRTYIITITSIIGIVVLESIALIKNLDGQLFSIVIAVLAGLSGYQVQFIKKRKENEDFN